MLKQRIITALALLAVLLPALGASGTWPFAALTLLMVGVAAWEWARLNGVGGNAALCFGALTALACAATWWSGLVGHAPAQLWQGAALVWGGLAVALLRRGVGRWGGLPVSLRLSGGLVALWLAWLALAGAKALGLNFLLSVFCVVWMADIAAYFGGRRFGKRKLAPTISPGKSWEGVFSGVLGVLLLAWAWLQVEPQAMSIFSVASGRFGALGLVACLLLLCAMSVVGDLVESLVKRSAGAKDSSALLPGHGGVLDRIDALIPVFPVAMAIQSL